jgi:rod shape-determining protein MreC
MHHEERAANYLLAILAGLALTLLCLPLTGAVQAMKAGLSYAFDPVAYYGEKSFDRFVGAPQRVLGLLKAAAESQRLAEELKQASLNEAEARALRLENLRLRSEMGLRPLRRHSAVWARVIEREPSQWYRSVLIDAGGDRQISLNAAVLAPHLGALVAVGRIVEVRPKTALVLLITDELSSVAAYTSSLSTESPVSFEGLLQGQGSSRLRLNYLSPEARVAPGDQVYTSAASATFPPDILIGQASSSFAPDPFLTFQSIEIKPALDPSQLRDIVVLSPQGEFKPAVLSPATADQDEENSEVEETSEQP